MPKKRPSREPPPILIERASPSTRKKFFEFFTVAIRNANTRGAYYRAIQQFLASAERAGYQELEDIEPITVAAYIETLQRRTAPPTVKQHMAAIRMLFSWLTEKGILAMNLPGKSKRRSFRALKVKRRHSLKVKFEGFLTLSRCPRTPAYAIALSSVQYFGLDFRPDRRRREPESRRILSSRETVFAAL
jgi:hypothetical protein